MTELALSGSASQRRQYLLEDLCSSGLANRVGFGYPMDKQQLEVMKSLSWGYDVV